MRLSPRLWSITTGHWGDLRKWMETGRSLTIAAGIVAAVEGLRHQA